MAQQSGLANTERKNARQMLKDAWEQYEDSALSLKIENYRKFQDWIAHHPADKMTLEQYTNLRTPQNQASYFTHLIEKETQLCGRFRAAGSSGFGIYREKPEGRGEAEERKYKTIGQSKNAVPLDHAEAENFFASRIRPVLIALSEHRDLKDGEKKALDINFARKVAYMYKPEELLPIYKNEVIEKIAAFFDIDVTLDDYRASKAILDHLKKEWALDEQEEHGFALTQKLGGFLYKKFGQSLDLNHKNIIYYGAPGTGKTHAVREGVKELIELRGDDAFDVLEFAQFHPSYSYEDFIEGLKPVNTPHGISLRLQSGRFKKFCKKAMDNLRAARSSNKEPANYYFIADEINRAELSRVLGEVLVCLEESKRVDFDEDGNIAKGLYLTTQYGHLDDADEAVLTLEKDEKKEHCFGVPANLYFIGTMNDVDRSIDSFDMALRRRFVWRRMDCDYEVIRSELASERLVQKYVDACKKLNDLICKDFELGYAYEIGHAYFLDIGIGQKTRISKSSMAELFDLKIKPLLAEYLRTVYNLKEVEEKLKDATRKFTLSPPADKNPEAVGASSEE